MLMTILVSVSAATRLALQVNSGEEGMQVPLYVFLYNFW